MKSNSNNRRTGIVALCSVVWAWVEQAELDKMWQIAYIWWVYRRWNNVRERCSEAQQVRRIRIKWRIKTRRGRPAYSRPPPSGWLISRWPWKRKLTLEMKGSDKEVCDEAEWTGWVRPKHAGREVRIAKVWEGKETTYSRQSVGGLEKSASTLSAMYPLPAEDKGSLLVHYIGMALTSNGFLIIRSMHPNLVEKILVMRGWVQWSLLILPYAIADLSGYLKLMCRWCSFFPL